MARAERPARLSIAAVVTYITAMAVSSWLGRRIVERQAIASGSPPSLRVMVAPNPFTPYSRSVVRDNGLWYETGTLSLTRDARYIANGEPIVKTSNAATLAAMATPAGRQFMSWSRFPFAEVTTDSVVTVRFDDARYASPGSRSFASTSIVVSRRVTAASDSASADRSKSQ